jgi:hypothetical protein
MDLSKYKLDEDSFFFKLNKILKWNAGNPLSRQTGHREVYVG